jgi:hypothetical protein
MAEEFAKCVYCVKRMEITREGESVKIVCRNELCGVPEASRGYEAATLRAAVDLMVDGYLRKPSLHGRPC